jgi:hypothetical protein
MRRQMCARCGYILQSTHADSVPTSPTGLRPSVDTLPVCLQSARCWYAGQCMDSVSVSPDNWGQCTPAGSRPTTSALDRSNGKQSFGSIVGYCEVVATGPHAPAAPAPPKQGQSEATSAGARVAIYARSSRLPAHTTTPGRYAPDRNRRFVHLRRRHCFHWLWPLLPLSAVRATGL